MSDKDCFTCNAVRRVLEETRPSEDLFFAGYLAGAVEMSLVDQPESVQGLTFCSTHAKMVDVVVLEASKKFKALAAEARSKLQ